MSISTVQPSQYARRVLAGRCDGRARIYARLRLARGSAHTVEPTLLHREPHHSEVERYPSREGSSKPTCGHPPAEAGSPRRAAQGGATFAAVGGSSMRRLVVALVAVALALTLAGCGGGGAERPRPPRRRPSLRRRRGRCRSTRGCAAAVDALGQRAARFSAVPDRRTPSPRTFASSSTRSSRRSSTSTTRRRTRARRTRKIIDSVLESNRGLVDLVAYDIGKYVSSDAAKPVTRRAKTFAKDAEVPAGRRARARSSA